MRQITTHETNDCNKAIMIDADNLGTGGASHLYVMRIHPGIGRAHSLEAIQSQAIKFQDGPIAEAGVNGLTHEVLYAILIDRLEGWQAGPYACEQNEVALSHIRAALAAAEWRTDERIERGVEGTHEV